MNIDAKKLKEVKLLISGLDNAGKTSSLIALRHKYNFFEQVKDLSPTIKIEYSSFDFLKNWKILLWDMGGQEKYREIYINKPIYFNDTNFFYFFIDIQDHFRYQTSIDYLTNLLNILEKTGFSNEVVICLHKYDPNIRENRVINLKVDEIKKKIQQLNGTQFEFKFFKTSLYDI
ncbi:MAG: hypothetical protein GF317_12510, partial [Candidatus Lokiarchaeota archaeon]|nr:hypothetical protein [Candidatus Lokiarchaeota archaeon]MBD3200469.1 hypothetical protein [Candidatus Lokiarchaeota archaeon]